MWTEESEARSEAHIARHGVTPDDVEDAAHTQRDTAEYIKNVRGLEYVMTVKGNQPQLLEAVAEQCLPLLKQSSLPVGYRLA